MIICCKNCTNRQRACHDTCKEYISEKQLNESKNAEIAKRKAFENAFVERVIRCKELSGKNGNFISAMRG